jgi:hypothetical protein
MKEKHNVNMEFGNSLKAKKKSKKHCNDLADDSLLDEAIQQAQDEATAAEERTNADKLAKERLHQLRNEQFASRLSSKKEEVERFADSLDKKYADDVKASLEKSLKELEEIKKEYDDYKKSLQNNNLMMQKFNERKDELLGEILKFKKMVEQLYERKGKFFTMDEKDKLDYVQGMEDYSQLCKDFPVVTRYIILDKQFSTKAFKKLFDRMINPPVVPAGEDKKEFQHKHWCDMNARYVSELFADINKNLHSSTREKKFYYTTVYEQLMKEYDRFKDQHHEKEIEISARRRKVAGTNIKNLLNAAVNRFDEVEECNEQTHKRLRELLLQLQPKVTFNKVLDELKLRTPLYDDGFDAKPGKGNPYAMKQKVQVNAYVDDAQAELLAGNAATSKYVEYYNQDEYEMLDEELYIDE